MGALMDEAGPCRQESPNGKPYRKLRSSESHISIQLVVFIDNSGYDAVIRVLNQFLRFGFILWTIRFKSSVRLEGIMNHAIQ
jgi:hypothetical protein